MTRAREAFFMKKCTEVETIDWTRLFLEFREYDTPGEALDVSPEKYLASLLTPGHPFVFQFVELKTKKGASSGEAVRDLYHYLLQKRYEERLNLLHFAFHIFDEETRLPEAIIDMTPFPHEEGIPKFKHFSDRTLNLSCP